MHCNMEYCPCPFKAGHSAIARSWNCSVESLKFTDFISVVNVGGRLRTRKPIGSPSLQPRSPIPLVSFPFTPEERNAEWKVWPYHSTPWAIGVWERGWLPDGHVTVNFKFQKFATLAACTDQSKAHPSTRCLHKWNVSKSHHTTRCI